MLWNLTKLKLWVNQLYIYQIRVALHYKENTEEYEDHVLEELRLNSPDENDFDYDPDAQESWCSP